MSHSDQPPGAAPVFPDVLLFGCPACQQELSIPGTLAGVEGPCLHCHVGIAAPIPASQLPARVLQAQPPSPPSPPPPPVAPRLPVAPAPARDAISVLPVAAPAPSPPQAVLASEPHHVLCQACGCELAIDPSMAHLPGGPCPRCQTWIDLSGNQSPPVAPPPQTPAPTPTREIAAETSAPPSRRRPPSPSATGPKSPSVSSRPVSELNKTTEGFEPEMNFPKLDNLEEPNLDQPPPQGERRRVKRRKRKRQLPPEFYVGHAAGELDARGQESAGKMRRSQFPNEKGGSRQRKTTSASPSEEGESGLARWLPVMFGILIPLLAGFFVTLHFDIVRAEDLRFREAKSSSTNTGNDTLADSVERTEVELSGKAKDAYTAIDTTFRAFFESDTWEEAVVHLALDHLPENSEALSFLKFFPREEYQEAAIKLIHFARIPKTERFIFTTHVSRGIDNFGDPRITFLIGEEQEQGPPKIHALQLYQSWKATLTEFLETPGATRNRFYAEVRLSDFENTFALPDDGDYVKLEVRDLLAKHIRTKAAYVRKDSWAGMRLLNTLNQDYSKAVVDLEWLKGPTGDAFVHIDGIHASNWGDFPK